MIKVFAEIATSPAFKEIFDFSELYYISRNSFVVKPNKGIEPYEALQGEKFAVKTGTNGSTITEDIIYEFPFNITIFDESTLAL